MKSFAILLFVVVANCAAVPVDKVQHVGVQPAHTGQIGGAHGQEHHGQGGIHKPSQQYVPVQSGQASVQYPSYGGQGQAPVHGSQGQAPVHGGQGQVEHGQGHVEHGQVVPIGIVSQESEVNPDGTFHNVWEGENGIKVNEQGTVQQTGEDTFTHTVTGEISYIDNDGKQILLKYVADETGFHPEGDHLPTPPPLPLGIARGLEYIRAHPPVEETKLSEKTLLTEGRTSKQHSTGERTEGY